MFFFFQFKRPDLNYELDGKIIPPDSLLNNTYEVDLESVYDEMSTKGKFVLDYDTGCHTLIVTNNRGGKITLTSRFPIL